MKEYSFNQLQDLVEEIYGENNPKKNLAINHLNFVSEDNDEFLRQIQMKFNVDFSSLPYNKYFDEDQFILLNLIKKILRYVGVLQKKTTSYIKSPE